MSTFEFKIYPIARDTRLGPKSTLKLATNTPLSELITESLNLVGVKGEVATRLYLLNQDLFAQDRASCLVSRDFCENTAHSELIDQSNIDIELADLSNGFSINNINMLLLYTFTIRPSLMKLTVLESEQQYDQVNLSHKHLFKKSKVSYLLYYNLV